MDAFRLELLPNDGSLGVDRSFEKGAVLWSRGKACNRIYVVKRGEVEISVPGEKGHDTIIRLVKPGEICGLFCFCSTISAPTTGRASVNTIVLDVDVNQFLEFLRSNPEVSNALLVTACDRLAFAEQRISVLAHRNGEDRIISLLLQLAVRSGRRSAEKPDLVRVQYTHGELARLSGMNRAHVSVILKRLREKGLILYGRSEPTRLNLPALTQYVEQRTPELSRPRAAGETKHAGPEPRLSRPARRQSA